MDFNLNLLQVTALAVALICALIDFRTTKIPNVITFPATLVGVVMNFFDPANGGGWAGVGNAVLGAVVGTLLTVAPKMKKYKDATETIGFGDAKLMMAMGAFLGWVGVLLVFFYFSLLWGGVAVYRFVSCIPWKTLIGGFLAKKAGGQLFSAETAQKIHTKMRTPIPLGPWIALGVFLSEVLYKGTLEFMGFQ